MVSAFAPEHFFNIGGPDSLNVFFSESALRGWESSVLFRCAHCVRSSAERSRYKHLFVVVNCSPKSEETFFTGMGKMDCGAGGVTFFLCFFGACLGALTCGIRLHNVSVTCPKRFRKEAPVLARPGAQTEPKGLVVGLAPASRGGSCVRFFGTIGAGVVTRPGVTR